MTQEDIIDIYKKSGALLEGHYELSSGLHSPSYLQSALVLQYPEYASMLCKRLAEVFKDRKIEVVIAPALGGIIVAYEVARHLKVRAVFAEREKGELTLRRGFNIKEGERTLVVEDVITTGISVKETITAVEKNKGMLVGVGSLIDRSGGKAEIGHPYHSLVVLNVPAYKPTDCPLCKSGKKITKPGSRGLRG
ncbi:MAG: orotate phosphoribosyltransferase [Nitrospirae bacterium]|nr:orotate phosphoribosyltransferase [Nitrospirota bacterium]